MKTEKSAPANAQACERRAQTVGLVYINDPHQGISRRRQGRGFTYISARGKRVDAPRTLKRIKALVIPPAWSDVSICAQSNGHIQAVGSDAKGRRR